MYGILLGGEDCKAEAKIIDNWKKRTNQRGYFLLG